MNGEYSFITLAIQRLPWILPQVQRTAIYYARLMSINRFLGLKKHVVSIWSLLEYFWTLNPLLNESKRFNQTYILKIHQIVFKTLRDKRNFFLTYSDSVLRQKARPYKFFYMVLNNFIYKVPFINMHINNTRVPTWIGDDNICICFSFSYKGQVCLLGNVSWRIKEKVNQK